MAIWIEMKLVSGLGSITKGGTSYTHSQQELEGDGGEIQTNAIFRITQPWVEPGSLTN